MAITARTRLVNPRLGTYFGIFTAAFAALFVLALMFEQLGASDGLLRLLMFGGPIVLYALVRWTGWGTFLFERPEWARIDGAYGRRAAALVPAE